MPAIPPEEIERLMRSSLAEDHRFDAISYFSIRDVRRTIPEPVLSHGEWRTCAIPDPSPRVHVVDEGDDELETDLPRREFRPDGLSMGTVKIGNDTDEFYEAVRRIIDPGPVEYTTDYGGRTYDPE